MSQFKRNLAIIIDINKYTNGISALSTAVHDAKEISRILQQKHDYKVWGLLDEQATAQSFWRLLEEFLPNNVTESDRHLPKTVALNSYFAIGF